MSNDWYSRPVLFVSDMKRSIDFYVKKFGFTESWRFEAEGGNASAAQVARPGIELILAAESPEKMGEILTPQLLITRPASSTISRCLPEASSPRKWAQPTGHPFQLT